MRIELQNPTRYGVLTKVGETPIEDRTKDQLVETVKGISPKYVIFDNEFIKYFSLISGAYSEWSGWNEERLAEARCSQLIKIYNFCINPNPVI